MKDSKGRPVAPANRNDGGRPTLCVPANYATFLNLIRIGMYFEQACAQALLSKKVVYDWLKKGASDEEPFATFLVEYNQASATAELTALSDIRAGKNNWQSRAWFLERRFRDRWGRNDKLEIKPVASEAVTAAAARKIMSEVFSGDVTPGDDVKPGVGSKDDEG